MTIGSEEVLAFWFDEVGEEGWYAVDEALDARIRERFLPAWERAREGGLDAWRASPRCCLALLILLDQFPRNMFRGSARSFATDARALAVAKQALRLCYDRRVEGAARQFFYLPLMHSETVTDQERAVRLLLLAFGDNENLKHARAHRAVIRRFGRFPYRNTALGRKTTHAEAAWMESGGYEAALAEVG